jgi:predicted SprT family Zn-dependent metalloprotease
MKIENILKSLKDHLEHYHLNNWTYEVENRSKRRFGVCYSRRRHIKISAKLGLINPPSVVNRVIKHEIAHALAPIEEHHGKRWQAICKAIGGDGKPRYSYEDTNTLSRPHHIPLEEISPTKVYSWTNKQGQLITIKETY